MVEEYEIVNAPGVWELDKTTLEIEDDTIWVVNKEGVRMLVYYSMLQSTADDGVMGVEKTLEPVTKTFTVDSGQRLTVSDPCYLESETGDKLVYDLEVASAGHMGWQSDDLVPGEWEAFVEYADLDDWGVRVSRSGIRQVLDNLPHIKYKIEHYQGVDAGMVGYFIGEPVLEYQETWPNPDPVLHTDPFGTMWCSESGIGDGSYEVNVGRLDSGQVVYISTNFQLEDWS